MAKNTEQTINDVLGDVLRSKHPRWKEKLFSERIGMFKEGAGMRPDIVIPHPGESPVIIETEIEPARTVEKDAISRLRKTLTSVGRKIEQAIAMILPEHLTTVSQDKLYSAIEQSEFRFCVLIDQGESNHHERWPNTGWISGGVNDLASFIEHSALSESVIAKGMEILEEAISQSANLLVHECYNRPLVMEEIAEKLKQKNNEQTLRMAMAILVNAVYFHSTIASTYTLPNVSEIKNSFGKFSRYRVLEVWEHILSDINYWPIFKIAREILVEIPEDVAVGVLERLTRASSDLVTVGATSQHDLSGRMFQRLITDRKFLATFYTLPSSATLLAELAIDRLNVDWSDESQITNLRIADFACGTGALLNATYGTISTRYRRTGGNDEEIHAQMMEQSLVGSDIMPAATHLTAAIVSSAHPSLPFKNTQIITLPYGERDDLSGQPISIGALDLIADVEVFPIFNTGVRQIKGNSTETSSQVCLPHQSFDIVIMNPPFTRPTTSEGKSRGVPIPSFAGFSTQEDERRQMSKKLKKIKRPGMVGHGNAGLASNFIDLANEKVKDNGIIALVLPATFASGESWAAARELFETQYSNVCIVSIAASGSGETAFSADTSISEVLIIANKKPPASDCRPVLYVNLERRPSSIMEAHELAKEIGKIGSADRMGIIHVGENQRLGSFFKSNMGFNGSFAIRNVELAEVMVELENGKFLPPTSNKSIDLPVTTLGCLGERGIYYRDIHGREKGANNETRGPFEIIDYDHKDVPSFPILWAHNAKNETKLIVNPDKQGQVRNNRLREATKIWKKFGRRLCFNENFRLSSQPLAACLTSTVAIGGQAWSGFICNEERYEVPLVLWANTTLGLMTFWWLGSRQQPGRSLLSISKLCSYITIDVQQFSSDQFAIADSIFDKFSHEDLLPANEAYRDQVRQDLDKSVLLDLLGLSESVLAGLDLLRRKWCSEPSVHGGKTTNPSNVQQVF